MFLYNIGIISAGGLLVIIDTDGEAAIAILFALGLAGSVAGLMNLHDGAPVTYEFPCTDYSLEYKVTTVEEKSDITYVLIRIKKMVK